jgi:hypothetical protein
LGNLGTCCCDDNDAEDETDDDDGDADCVQRVIVLNCIVELGVFDAWCMDVAACVDADAVFVVVVVVAVVAAKLIRLTRLELLSFVPVVMFRYCDVPVDGDDDDDDDDGDAVAVAPPPAKPKLLLVLMIFNFFRLLLVLLLLIVLFTFELLDNWCVVVAMSVDVVVVGVDARIILRAFSRLASSAPVCWSFGCCIFTALSVGVVVLIAGGGVDVVRNRLTVAFALDDCNEQ